METAVMDHRLKVTSLDTAVHEYIDFKKATAWRASGGTAKSISSTLRVFLRMFDQQRGRAALTTDLSSLAVARAVNACWPNDPNKGTHLTSTNRIKDLLKWLRYHKYATGDVEVFLATVVKHGKPDAPALPGSEMLNVFNLTRPRNPRGAWLIRIGYELSLRAGELVSLRVRDITAPARDAPYGWLVWDSIKAGEGKVKRRLISEEREVIDQWLAEYEQLIGEKPQPDYYLFPASRGHTVRSGGEPRQRLVPQTKIGDPGHIWREAFKEAGVWIKGKASHAGRRGGMTDEFYELERAGVPDPLQHIQRKVRHKDRKTTAIYIALEEGDKETFEVRQRLADIRSGKIQAPNPQQETDVSGRNESTADTGETLATVVYPTFGRRRA